MKKTIYLIMFLTIGGMLMTSQNHKSINILFCDIQFPEIYKKANCSFSIFAFFNVDKNGNPINIKVTWTLKDVTNKKKIEDCMKKWKFVGFSSHSKFVARWTWNHGKGWEPLFVSFSGIDLHIDAIPK